MIRPDLERAARMAYRLLLREGSGKLPVDPAGLLCRCRDVRLVTWQDVAKANDLPPEEFAAGHTGVEAIVWVNPADGSRVVASRTDGNPCRLRFTLAHELGHVALRHAGEGEHEEREADCFASHLLAPRPVIRELMRRGPLWCEQLERLFFVSHSMLTLAAREHFAMPQSVDEAEIQRLFAPSIPEKLPGGEPRLGWLRLS